MTDARFQAQLRTVISRVAGEEEVSRRNKTLSVILPLSEVLYSIDQHLASKYDQATDVNGLTVDEDVINVSRAANAALYAISSVYMGRFTGFGNDMELSNKQLLEKAKMHNCWQAVQIRTLTEKLFLELAPHLRNVIDSQSDEWMLNTIQWSDTLGRDIVAEINFIRLY